MQDKQDETEKLMKRCQTGCYKIDDANDLLSECYGHIGWLSNELRKAQGVITLGRMIEKKQSETS